MWCSLAWPELAPPQAWKKARGRQGVGSRGVAQHTLNDECDYFTCDSERLRELDRACVSRRQAGTRHHGKYGEGGQAPLM